MSYFGAAVCLPAAAFEIDEDEASEYRWRPRHRNGNIIADFGQGYADRRGAIEGIHGVKHNTPGAERIAARVVRLIPKNTNTMPHNTMHMNPWALVGAYLLGFLAFQAYLYSDRSLPVGAGAATAGSGVEPGLVSEDAEHTRCEACGTLNRSDAAFNRCRECTDRL